VYVCVGVVGIETDRRIKIVDRTVRLSYHIISNAAACQTITTVPPPVRKLDPKNLGRIRPELNVVPFRLPSAKSTAKVPPFSMRGVPGNGGKSKRRRKTTPVLVFLPFPNQGHCDLSHVIARCGEVPMGRNCR
jgi:hypothetical protein